MSSVEKLTELQHELAKLARILIESDERRKDELHMASEALLKCTTTSTELRAALAKKAAEK